MVGGVRHEDVLLGSERGAARGAEPYRGLLQGRVVDSGALPLFVVQRTFCIEAATGFCPCIQIGVLRLDSMAWQLAARDGVVAAPASGLRGERRVVLNLGPCPGIEC